MAVQSLVLMFMLLVFFLTGLMLMAVGLSVLLSKEVREATRKLSANSIVILAAHPAVSGKSLDGALSPAMDSAARLIESIANLIRTSAGVGAFLCVLGFVVDMVSIWLLNALT